MVFDIVKIFLVRMIKELGSLFSISEVRGCFPNLAIGIQGWLHRSIGIHAYLSNFQTVTEIWFSLNAQMSNVSK